jgi:hypothetical protein
MNDRGVVTGDGELGFPDSANHAKPQWAGMRLGIHFIDLDTVAVVTPCVLIAK